MDAVRKRERDAILRFGLIAATIVNVNRKLGSALVQPEDFIVEMPRAEDFMSAEAAEAFMGRWAAATNEAYAATGSVPDV